MANPPIIIKKKAAHAGHHGGAWKVAYADFVTAMMALFIVLWLLNSSKQVQEAVGGYFKDPSGNSKMVGSTLRGAGQNLDLRKEEMKKIKEALEKQVKSIPDFEKLKEHITMTITAEGLRIELTESEKGTFFELGSSVPSPDGVELLAALASEVGKLPNTVSIEGHTDSRPYSGAASGGYSNWELSADRANAARKIMQSSGLQSNQVSQVRGFADQQLKIKDDPEDPGNRRITLIVQYLDNAPPPEPAQETSAASSEPGKAVAAPAVAGKK